MAIRDLKITPEQIARKGVIASPDTLTGTPDENKNVFDRLAREIIVPSVNGAIEMLGQVEDDTVQWESDEQARKLAEQERVSAEQGRAAAEQTRVQAEQERANADGLRTTAEEKRVAAEQARSIAEQERVHAENSRVAAEQEREVAEQGRKAAEEARAQTERDRMLWETYSAIKNYVPGNKVEHGGSSYVNIAPCTGIAPPNSAHWQLVAARGKDGDGAGDMIKAVYDPTGKEQDIFAYSVPQTRKINKKPLSADVTLTGEDIPAGAEDEKSLSSHLAECKKALENKLSVPTAIPKYTNLNALKTPGMYYCGAAMESPNIPPNPLGEGAFALLVESTYAVGVSQSLTWYVSGKTHKRLCTNTNDDEWTDWVPIATATPPEEIPLNLAAGFQPLPSYGSNTLSKNQFGEVTLQISVTKTSVETNDIANGSDLCTLPAGFRPAHLISGACYADRFNAELMPSFISAYPDGSVRVCLARPVNCSAVIASISFIATA